MRPTPGLYLVVAAGGAVGATLRYALGEWVPDGGGFPFTTFAINVSGSLLLALLPALGWISRSRVRTAAVGPGLLGGYTTLSAYAVQARDLLADGQLVVAGTYVLGTLAACYAAVLLAATLSTAPERDVVADEGGDE